MPEIIIGRTPCEISGMLGMCGMECKALREGDCKDPERLAEWEDFDEGTDKEG